MTVDSCDSKGITTLHKAAFHGHRGMVQLLLKHSAAINVKTKDDMLSPLHLACQYNHKDVSDMLSELMITATHWANSVKITNV